MTQEEAGVFAEGYLRVLDSRVARSELTGTITLKDRSVALFFDRNTGKFTLLEKTGEDEAVSVFDAIPREQWGRMVMVFGHETNTGGYIASGHGTLTGDQFTVRLANGRYYRFTVDPTLPHLTPYFVERVRQEDQVTRPAKRKKSTVAEPKERRVPESPNGIGEGGTRTIREIGPGHSQDALGNDRHSGDGSHGDEHEDFTPEDLARLRGEVPMANKKSKRKK